MAIEKRLAELYISILGRAPDAEGLAFWVNAVNSGGMTIEEIGADWFTAQKEVLARYETMDAKGFIEVAYQNTFGRAPDPGGLEFWRPLIQNGIIPRQDFINAIIEGAKAPTGGPVDVAMLSNRAEIGLAFAQLDAAANSLAAEIIKLVTPDASSVSLASSVLALIPSALSSSDSPSALSNIGTLIDTLVNTALSNPAFVSGLASYISAVSAQLATNTSVDVAAVLRDVGGVVQQAVLNPLVLLDAVGLAQSTVGGNASTGSGTNTPDTTAPTLLGAALAADGKTLTLTYDETLSTESYSQPASNHFKVNAKLGIATISDVSITEVQVIDKTVTLTLETIIAKGADVKLNYTGDTIGNDSYVIEDRTGNDAIDLTGALVTNNSQVNAPVLGIDIMNNIMVTIPSGASGARLYTEGWFDDTDYYFTPQELNGTSVSFPIRDLSMYGYVVLNSIEAKATDANGVINSLATSGGVNIFIGSGLDDSMPGTSDGDLIYGRGGDDTILGRGGADVIIGGEGNNIFVYSDVNDGGALIEGSRLSGDLLKDFTPGSDTLQLTGGLLSRFLTGTSNNAVNELEYGGTINLTAPGTGDDSVQWVGPGYFNTFADILTAEGLNEAVTLTNDSVGQERIFVFLSDDDVSFALYYWASNGNGQIEASELTLLASGYGFPSSQDFSFV